MTFTFKVCDSYVIGGEQSPIVIGFTVIFILSHDILHGD